MSEVVILPEAEVPPPDPRAGRYVTFRLANGEFGAPVDKVLEIMEMQEITTVPNSPAFIAGVINLRGKVIPVIDLRGIFELPAEPATSRSCIMVARALLSATEQVIGIVVDTVLEVLTLQSGDFLGGEDLQRMTDLGALDGFPYLVGVARSGGSVKLLLDIDEVLNNVDLRRGRNLAAAA